MAARFPGGGSGVPQSHSAMRPCLLRCAHHRQLSARWTPVHGDLAVEGAGVLTRFEKRTNLTPEAAAAIRTRIEWAGDRLLLERAKRALELHDGRGARQQLVGIRRKSVKARAVLAALLLAPSLTPVLYRFWRHRYQRRRTTA